MSVTIHNRKVMESLELGDMVEFPRGNYSHWAVYIGNGKVVHKIKNKDEDKYCIQIDDFMEIAGNEKARKNNSKDDKYRPFSGEEIVKRGITMAENGAEKYNLVLHNCEHFASLLRYGEEVSYQVDKAIKIAVAAGATLCLCTGIAITYKAIKEREKQHQYDAMA